MLPWFAWTAMVAGLGIGLLVGHRVHPLVSARAARLLLLIIAALGGTVIAARGFIGLFAA